MKKFYVLAAAAAVALSAAAQDKIYVVGSWGGEDHWNSKGMIEIAKDGDNYKFDLKQLSAFKMSTKPLTVTTGEDGKEQDSWDEFNANCYSCNYGFIAGVEKELAKGDGNIATPYLGDYTVTVAGDFSKIKLETETPNPGFHVYFRGNMNDWANDETIRAEWEFECIDETNLIYKYVCDDTHSIAADTSFKLADAGWGSINFGMPQKEQVDADGKVVLDENGNPTKVNYEFMPMEEIATLVYNNGDIKCTEEFYGVAYFNLNTAEFFMSNDPEAENPFGQGAVEGITVDNNAPAAYYTLQGVRVSEPANGLYIVVKDGKATKVIK